jgi:predicted nucleic acid-binding protein
LTAKKPMPADAVPAFCDTNILLYRFIDDPKSYISKALMAEPFAISVQVLNEFANVARRKLRVDWNEINTRLILVRALASSIYPITLENHSLGLHFAERYQLAVYDSMIVASALLAGCNTLYSEDMQHGMIIEGRLTIRNPFITV